MGHCDLYYRVRAGVLISPATGVDVSRDELRAWSRTLGLRPGEPCHASRGGACRSSVTNASAQAEVGSAHRVQVHSAAWGRRDLAVRARSRARSPCGAILGGADLDTNIAVEPGDGHDGLLSVSAVEALAGRRCCQAADTTSKSLKTFRLRSGAVDRFPRCWRGVISRTAFLTLKAAASRKRGDQARRGRSSGGSGRCLTMARVGGSNLSNHGAAGRGTSSRSGPGCATPTRPVRTTDFRASCQNRPAIGIHYLDHCAGQPKTPAGSGPVS